MTGGRFRRGFSMLETVIALAILSLGAAIVTTSVSKALDQMAVHAAFQDLQTALTRLRAEAFESGVSQTLTAEAAGLQPGWTVRAEAPLTADSGGVCSAPKLELLRGEAVRARLVAADRACHYLRAT